MKLSLLFFFVVFILTQAHSFAQEKKISLTLENATILQAIEEIEKQTGFFFLYQDDVFDKKLRITIRVKNEPLNVILREFEKQASVKTELIKNQIILRKKEVKENIPDPPQKKKITGKVIDKYGNPIARVSVVVEGTTIGTTTDYNGYYELEIPLDASILAFSFVGMLRQEVSIRNMTVVNVVLEKDEIGIREVVAVGYGTIRNIDNTGAISSLKSKAFKDFPISSVEQGMQGRMAGIQVIQTSGQPGTGISVRIRGVSSFAGGNEPLYVIDGFPVYNHDVRYLNGLSGLNPDDIQSVEVLKDAVATAIYGSRASNGVILITTKDGTSGKTRITFDSYFAVQKVRKKLPMMNGEDYINFATEYFNNAINISEEQRQINLNALTSYGNANTDWQDEVMRTALHQNYKLGISGGNDKNKYYLSMNYMNQEGIIKSTDFTRFGFRLNIKSRINTWLDISAKTNVSKVIQNAFVAGIGTNSRNIFKSGIGSTLLAPSTVPVFNKEGNYSAIGPYPFSFVTIENPAALLNALDKNTMYNFRGVLDINAILFPGFSNTLRIGSEMTNKVHDLYLPKELVQMGSQTAQLEEYKKTGILVEDFFTFKKSFSNNLALVSVLGFSAQQDEFQTINLVGTGFPTDDLQNNSIQSAYTSGIPQTMRIKSTLASFFSRNNLNYLNKYLLSFSVRSDGASVFSQNNKWATFPAFGFAWRIDNEDFLNASKISNLKLRAGLGRSGNQAVSPYQSLIVGQVVNTGQGAGNGSNVGLAPNLPNKDLTWETTNQTNIGLDFGVFNERGRFSFDYYTRTTNDLLASVQLPKSSGFIQILDNIGKVQNKGFEFTVGGSLINTSDWLFTFDFSFSKNKNIVLATKNNQDIISGGRNDASLTTTIVRVGEPLFSFYMPKFLGIDNTGRPMYDDKDKNGVIDDADNQIAGSSLADFFYGLNLNLEYKKLSLSMNWQGVSGSRINNTLMWILTNPEPSENRIKNIKEFYPHLSDNYGVVNTDRHIEDASYLRLKNIRISYQLSDIHKVLSRFSVYVSGQNLITFTGYSGYDPEVNSFSNSNQLQGIDYAAFPSAKAITIGINAEF